MVIAQQGSNRKASKARLTLEDYLSYDDGTDLRYELVDGVLVEMGAESTINTRIAVFLLLAFARLGVPDDRLGIKQKIAISPSLAREPDLMIHSEGSARAIDGATQAMVRLEHPVPLVVIEVVSPGEPGEANYDRDYLHKRQEYAVRGIDEYWIVDPTRQVVLVLNLVEGTYQEQQFIGEEAIASLAFPALRITTKQALQAAL